MKSERGDAMAWMAIVMVFLMLPLMGITMDITRAMYVRGHLQAASDAGCQAAADAMMVPLFMETGEQRIDAGLIYGRAAQVFNATLKDSGKVRFRARFELAPAYSHFRGVYRDCLGSQASAIRGA